MHQRGNLSSFDRDIEQDRRGGQVHIPEVVMHGLEIPFELAGRCIECNDGIAEEIISFAVETVVVARRTAEDRVDGVALRIHTHVEAPVVRARAILPAI